MVAIPEAFVVIVLLAVMRRVKLPIEVIILEEAAISLVDPFPPLPVSVTSQDPAPIEILFPE